MSWPLVEEGAQLSGIPTKQRKCLGKCLALRSFVGDPGELANAESEALWREPHPVASTTPHARGIFLRGSRALRGSCGLCQPAFFLSRILIQLLLSHPLWIAAAGSAVAGGGRHSKGVKAYLERGSGAERDPLDKLPAHDIFMQICWCVPNLAPGPPRRTARALTRRHGSIRALLLAPNYTHLETLRQFPTLTKQRKSRHFPTDYGALQKPERGMLCAVLN